MLVDVALNKHSRDIGVKTDSKQHCSQFQRLTTENPRCVGDGEGMEVDDAMEDVRLVLTGDPIAESSEVVPEVHDTCGLYAREHPGHGAETSL